MKTRLLIASEDIDYGEHLSCFLSDKYAHTFDVNLCSSADQLSNLLQHCRYDTALLEPELAAKNPLSSIAVPLLLCTDNTDVPELIKDLLKVQKYQRISALSDEVISYYAKNTSRGHIPSSKETYITAVWSPAGGVGKTSVALAYCAQKASSGKEVLYLNLESFSSIPVYFADSGKSVSSIFEMLEKKDGNIDVLINGLRRKDETTGISYFCEPENYDDINILNIEDTSTLISTCCRVTQELVIDMSCACNKRSWQVFEHADRVLIVVDNSKTSLVKLKQFISQHNIFELIKSKCTIIANKGADIPDIIPDQSLTLPYVESTAHNDVYTKLSTHALFWQAEHTDDNMLP